MSGVYGGRTFVWRVVLQSIRKCLPIREIDVIVNQKMQTIPENQRIRFFPSLRSPARPVPTPKREP